ncbi:MAG TPA: TIGR01777 family oxidoreductase [Candidatus Goldiibacteriota bacterium]|nr:TIGR01777 family oxidoreductase [Candidatus Goldiibacteriota bacterium]
MQKKVVVTGATGFIGSRLCAALKDKGYEVIAVTRKKTGSCSIFERKYFCAEWNVADTFIDSAFAVINLAGENIGSGLWNDEKRQSILRSRLEAGEMIVEAVERAAVKPRVLIQASASGYYGQNEAGGPVEESAAPGNSFLADVCRKWEDSTLEAEAMGVRRVITRFAPVIGNGGGFLRAAETPFKFFLGGVLGRQDRPFPWVHVNDAVSAIIFLMEDDGASGPVNICAPEMKNSGEFYRELGKALKRPVWLPVPDLFLKALPAGMGQELFINTCHMSCKKLLGLGFKFNYGELASAMKEIYG